MAASWTSTETAPYAFVPGWRRSARRPPSAPSRTTAGREAASRECRRRPWRRRCTAGWRRASSPRAGASRRRPSSRRRIRGSRSTARRAPRGAWARATRRPRRRGRAARDRRGTSSARRGRARSRARRPLRRAWPAGRSRAGCWDRRESAVRAPASVRRRRSCDREHAVRVLVDRGCKLLEGNAPSRCERFHRVDEERRLVRAPAPPLWSEERASVSARMRSAGTCCAASRSSVAFGYVTLPANET